MDGHGSATAHQEGQLMKGSPQPGDTDLFNGDLETQVRQRIESLSYLPTTVAVAMKFIHLGRNPEADPADYAKVIGSDGALSSKLLSLANSSWFGVRNRVTRVQVAVNLLGLGTVRTLAISYCMTGLHNELRLSPQESRMFWIASLCKAVAAREFAVLFDPNLGEEAFAAALLQDFALPVMYATARQPVLELLHDSSLDCKARLQQERRLFHLDHAELGRCIAQKLELPELFVDAVAFHHSPAGLAEFVDSQPLADACYAASLFPHLLDVWNQRDAGELQSFIRERCAGRATPEQFLPLVDRQFRELYRYFEQSDPPEHLLTELLEQTLCQVAREAADNTTAIISTMQDLMQQAASAGQQVHQLLQQQGQLAQAAEQDKLTGTLNREGFARCAADAIGRAGRYGSSFAVAYLDVDQFKRANDTLGHTAGDQALQAVAAQLQEQTRPADVVGRIGGDEFAILLTDCGQEQAVQIVGRILESIACQLIPGGSSQFSVTASAGVIWIPPRSQAAPMDRLLQSADLLMYEAKRAGGNQLRWRQLGAARDVA
jgi:diguanylate cyclase (GGDEF)-like protein